LHDGGEMQTRHGADYRRVKRAFRETESDSPTSIMTILFRKTDAKEYRTFDSKQSDFPKREVA